MLFNAPSGASQTELATRAKNLEIYVYGGTSVNRGAGNPSACGDAPGKQNRHVVMCNSIQFAGTIYGPTLKILLHNSVTMTGAVAARDLTLWNSVTFRRPDGLSGAFGGTGANAQTAWTQCESTRPTAADPESGCAD